MGNASKDDWIAAQRNKSDMFSMKRNLYWSNLVGDNKDPKKLLSVVNKVLCKNCNDDLSDEATDQSAHQFLCFLKKKLIK